MRRTVSGETLSRAASSTAVNKWLDDLPAEPKAGHRPVSMLDDERVSMAVDTLGAAGNSGPLISNEGVGATDPIPKPFA